MAVKIGNASISENGTIRGKAGDQTGREVVIKNWYRHSKGWITLRAKDPAMRAYIAEAMEKACKNNDIGYSQPENQTLWNNVKTQGYDPSKTTKKVNTDCARLVRVCCQYACEKVGNGKKIPDFYTANLVSKLMSTGLFDKSTADKYTKKSDYLLRGDIQVTRTKGHTLVILTNGSKAGNEAVPTQPVAPEVKPKLGDRILKNGMEGDDVKELQSYLIQLGYDCGSWGADGDFGDATEIAVGQFQANAGIGVDGQVGPQTLKALSDALEDKVVENPKKVKIMNGNCYVREQPNTSGKTLGIVYKGETYPYAGETSPEDWKKINFKGTVGWVSGRYSEIM